MLSWKISFVKASGSFIFLSALAVPRTTGARGRLLLAEKFIFAMIRRAVPKGRVADPQSARARAKGTVSYGSPRHGVTGGCGGGGAEARGTARRVAIDFSSREFSTDAVVVASFPRSGLSALSLFFSRYICVSSCLSLTRPT